MNTVSESISSSPKLAPPVSVLGLIAGSGDFPIQVARAAKVQGVQQVVAVGFKSQTDPHLEQFVDQLHYIGVGQLGKLIDIFKKSQVGQAVMAGKLQHKLIFQDLLLDMKMLGLMARLKDRRADTILGGIADVLEKEGIVLIDSTAYLAQDLACHGYLAGPKPTKAQWADVEFGRSIAWELARLDIGQTVAVKERAVVALEGFEGTDEMILRAGKLGGKGVVVVKVSKPHQDMRFDVPVVGKATLHAMYVAKASVLAVAANRTLMLDREVFFAEARRLGIGVVGVLPGAPAGDLG